MIINGGSHKQSCNLDGSGVEMIRTVSSSYNFSQDCDAKEQVKNSVSQGRGTLLYLGHAGVPRVNLLRRCNFGGFSFFGRVVTSKRRAPSSPRA